MSPTPATYAIRVEGHLDDHWSGWLGGLDMTRDDDGATTVTVQVADQAQLHGVLAGLRDMGAVISELRTGDARAPVCPPALERPLRSERLTLRPAGAGDAGPTWRYRRLACVAEWLASSPAGFDGYRERFSEPARLASTVIVGLGHDAAAPVIGDVMLRRQGAWGELDGADQARGTQAELRWVLHPAWTGRGYATEAVRALLRCCFQDLGVRRITATCFSEDDRSRRLMERVGMRREARAVRAALHRSGRWLDTVGYAILDEEWSPA